MPLSSSFLRSASFISLVLLTGWSHFRSVTTNDCKHLIIDAGHISIESDLADKKAIRTIRLKRNQKYTDEDYHYLESLMYDKMSLKLDAAQVSS